MKRLLLLAVVVALPVSVYAYLPGGPAVLKRMAAVREELQLRSLVVRGEMTFEGEEAGVLSKALNLESRDALTVPAVVSYKMPGHCRVAVMKGGQGGEAAAAVRAQGAVSAVGPALASLKTFAAQVCELLDPRGGADGVVAWAKEQGIDAAKVNLGRMDGEVAYVVGARAKDANVPSLWVDKDLFSPIKLVTREGSTWREVRLKDYSSAAAGQWHPRVVEIRRDGQVRARFVAERAEPNAHVADL